MNESNEIVETLRHENAGLKETINRMEVSAKSITTVEKKSKKSNKRDNVEEIQGLNAALEKRFVFAVTLVQNSYFIVIDTSFKQI